MPCKRQAAQLSTTLQTISALPLPSGGVVDPLPWPKYPAAVMGDFVAPHLIVPVDMSNTNKVAESSFTAHLSQAMSTLLQYEVKPSAAGKTCTLVFYMPPIFQYPDMSPVKVKSPGGISVLTFGEPFNGDMKAVNLGTLTSMGLVRALEHGHLYSIPVGPCQVGRPLNLMISSIEGLDMTWFQLVSPPIGPFLQIT